MLIGNQRQSHKPEQARGRDGSSRVQTITSKMSIAPCTGGPRHSPSLYKIAASCREIFSLSVSAVLHLPSRSSALGPVALTSLAPSEMCWGFQKYAYY